MTVLFTLHTNITTFHATGSDSQTIWTTRSHN